MTNQAQGKPWDGHTPLPCPVCKGETVYCPDDSYGNEMVYCPDSNNCPADVKAWGDANTGEALTIWNTRVNKGPAADEMAEALEAAVAEADGGVKACPINNGKQRGTERCSRCGSDASGNCASIDAANERAVRMVRKALSNYWESVK